jgi:uncharacterized membrane protein
VHPAAKLLRLQFMKTIIPAFLSTAVAMLALDSIWLTLTAKPLYRAQIGDLMLPRFDPVPAAAFYLVYVLAVVVLVVQPALAEGRLLGATTRGALFGLAAYATYDLTNQATLRGWPITVTIADLCWGTCLTAVAATAGYWVTTLIVSRLA